MATAPKTPPERRPVVPISVAKTVPVTADNFVRAESDLYFSNIVKDGAFGKFVHNRLPTLINRQTVIRMNRDTLYSAAVFDLDAGPATITLPDAGARFMSMQVITEDHYCAEVTYKPGSYTFTKERVGTRYVCTAVRTLVDPSNSKDFDQVHALQNEIKVSQLSSGRFEVPEWDATSQKKIRDALIVLGSTVPDSKNMFGTKEQVEPVRHLIGSAIAWGGNPTSEAIYLNVTPRQNDGRTIHRLTVRDVPVDGFWSINVYNAEVYFEPNPKCVLSQKPHSGSRCRRLRDRPIRWLQRQKCPIACRSCRAGTTLCAFLARVPKY